MPTNRNHKPAIAVASLLVVCGVIAWAQTPTSPTPTPVVSASGSGLSVPAAANPDAPDFGTPIKVDVNNLVAPVLVTDRDHNIIDGLQPQQFHLYDNGVEQNIHVNEAYEPVSIVVAIEKSSRVDGVLPQLHKLGILLSQITGKQGEAAVMAFDCHLAVTQDFTADNDKIINAINNIKSGCSSDRLIDAVEEGVHMLSKRPKDNRKIILLVSETRDEGSQARLKDVMMDLTLSNVQVYPVDISQVAVRFNEKQDQPAPRADIDVANLGLPNGIASTPTTMDQYYGLSNRVQFIPLLKEIFIDTKGIFVKDPATQFANATGAHQFVFLKQKGLEEAVQRISQEVHSQYLVSYAPSNISEGGFHTITVQIDREPTYICTTRLGYWIGGGAQ
jgi:VWFA-related protein